jgi:glycerate-2-kinase
VARISSKMVCSAIVSDITGTPDRPRREASGPLWAMPPRPMCASCGRSQTV